MDGMPLSPFPLVPPEVLHRTLGFWLAMLAFLTLSTKFLAVLTHGLIGTAVLSSLAMLAMMSHKSIHTVQFYIVQGVARNRGLFLFALWYASGVLGKLCLTEAARFDMHAMAPPILNLVALFFAFGLLREHQAARAFQISYILFISAQCLATIYLIVFEIVDVRQEVQNAGGAWPFGDQHFFVTQAIVLPLLVWRACVERGVLRLSLLVCCGVIVWSLAICQFGTPAGVLLVGVPATALLALLHLRRTSGVLRIALPVLLLVGGCLIVARVSGHPLLQPIRERVVNVWDDPTSGGYDAHSAVEGSRWMLASISIASFADSPCFGKGADRTRADDAFVGGHSSFFDSLALHGLLGGGGALVGMMMVLFNRAFVRMLRIGDWESVCATASMIMLVVAGVVNPYWGGLEVMSVLFIGRLFRFEGEPL